ncbi:MAG: Ig-like domain-containing protein, partial [Anaerolineae bacterium]|nr:Ig-like domain-containing protein [Anaerolineae bacterium]
MIFIVALLSIPMLVAGCGGGQPNKPTIALKSLTDGSQFELGQVVPISYEAADVKGIVQVELTINGEPIHVETVSPPVNVFSGSFSWRPQTGGSHLIQVLSFNVDGASSDLAQVAVTVV